MKALVDLDANYVLITKTPMSGGTPKTVFQNSRWNVNGLGGFPQVIF
jgi:hypothetical protein